VSFFILKGLFFSEAEFSFPVCEVSLLAICLRPFRAKWQTLVCQMALCTYPGFYEDVRARTTCHCRRAADFGKSFWPALIVAADGKKEGILTSYAHAQLSNQAVSPMLGESSLSAVLCNFSGSGPSPIAIAMAPDGERLSLIWESIGLPARWPFIAFIADPQLSSIPH